MSLGAFFFIVAVIAGLIDLAGSLCGKRDTRSVFALACACLLLSVGLLLLGV